MSDATGEQIYDYKVDLLYDDFPIDHIHSWEEGIVYLIADDTCGDNCTNYYDFSTLPDGRYYIYYWSLIGVFHEIEIILDTI